MGVEARDAHKRVHFRQKKKIKTFVRRGAPQSFYALYAYVAYAMGWPCYVVTIKHCG